MSTPPACMGGTNRVENATAAAACPVERRYANHLGIGFNRLEFLLDFAQAYEERGELTHTRLVAAPAHMKQFAALMQVCLADYEERYGPIPGLAGPAPQDR